MDPLAPILLAVSFWGSVGGLMGARWEWTTTQTVLWPVTLVVRAITGDPLQNEPTTPKKYRPDYDKIFDLERELGQMDTISFREAKGLRTGLKEAIREHQLAEEMKVRLQIALEAGEIRHNASLLVEQCPAPYVELCARDVVEVLDLDPPNLRLGWELLRQGQVWVGLHGSEGIEAYDSEEDLYDRYDELRIHLFRVEHGAGDALMIDNARRRLIRWCARHHNPRYGRIFPSPTDENYVAYPESYNP